MTNDVAKKIVDLLFEMSNNSSKDFIINNQTKGIIIDFIGGEPLMNLNTIDYTCSYFMDKCLELNHYWTKFWRASLISNGKYYFINKT